MTESHFLKTKFPVLYDFCFTYPRRSEVLCSVILTAKHHYEQSVKEPTVILQSSFGYGCAIQCKVYRIFFFFYWF